MREATRDPGYAARPHQFGPNLRNCHRGRLISPHEQPSYEVNVNVAALSCQVSP